MTAHRPRQALYAWWLGFALLLILGGLVSFALDRRVGDVMSGIGLVGSTAFAVRVYLTRNAATQPPDIHK